MTKGGCSSAVARKSICMAPLKSVVPAAGAKSLPIKAKAVFKSAANSVRAEPKFVKETLEVASPAAASSAASPVTAPATSPPTDGGVIKTESKGQRRRARKKAAKEAAAKEAAAKEAAGVSDQVSPVVVASPGRWTNRQRTLVMGTRGLRTAHRFLMTDVKNMLAHHHSELKWEKKTPFDEIPETAELNDCNNVIFFETRKLNLYLYFARCPLGPSVKFQAFNVHTSESMNFIGNCLKYSRPLMVFDDHFEKLPQLRLIKEIILQACQIPRYHPKSKPFHDHVVSWFWNDDRIWFRHYQIYSDKFDEKIDDQQIREIGPRFCLQPVVIYQGAFGGPILWKNPQYKTPTRISAEHNRALKDQK